MLNKILSAQPKETESALNKSKNFKYSVLIIVLVVLVSLFKLFALHENKSNELIAPYGAISIETVDSPEKRQLGLSGRTAISDSSGMMFIFDQTSSSNCFWMKDMNFSIDMVWLNENKKVINVTENVSPESYPESFCPSGQAKYGLELGAKRATGLGIKPNQELIF